MFLVCSKRTCSDSSGITSSDLGVNDVPLKSANDMTAFHDLLSNDGFTIEMWVDLAEYSIGNTHTMFGFGFETNPVAEGAPGAECTNGFNMHMQVNADGKLALSRRTAEESLEGGNDLVCLDFADSQDYRERALTHVVLSKGENSLRFWQMSTKSITDTAVHANGQSYAAAIGTRHAKNDFVGFELSQYLATAKLMIGGIPSGYKEGIQGTVYMVAVYNKFLTAEEIEQNYEAKLPDNAPLAWAEDDNMHR